MAMCVVTLSVHAHSCYVHLFNRGWLESDGKTIKGTDITIKQRELDGKPALKLNGVFTSEDLMALATAMIMEKV